VVVPWLLPDSCSNNRDEEGRSELILTAAASVALPRAAPVRCVHLQAQALLPWRGVMGVMDSRL
jgi:hypothetical protein